MSGRDDAIDVARYFIDHAGTDKKLSWSEIQKNPLRVTGGEGAPSNTITITKDEFDKAQSSQYDNDSEKLNYREWLDFFYKGSFAVPIYYEDPNHTDLPHCGESDLRELGTPPEKVAKIRSAIRTGIAESLQDTWTAKKTEIRKAVSEGKSADAIGLLSKYISEVATTTHHYNAELRDLCYLGCVSSLFEIEEFASNDSLSIKTIKDFWKDVGALFGYVLDKAAKSGVKDLNDLWTGKLDGEHLSYYADESGPSSNEVSDFTLMSLLEKTNPDIIKRIESWNK